MRSLPQNSKCATFNRVGRNFTSILKQSIQKRIGGKQDHRGVEHQNHELMHLKLQGGGQQWAKSCWNLKSHPWKLLLFAAFCPQSMGSMTLNKAWHIFFASFQRSLDVKGMKIIFVSEAASACGTMSSSASRSVYLFSRIFRRKSHQPVFDAFFCLFLQKAHQA